MDKDRVIYRLTVEDIFNVMEENSLQIDLNEERVRFIEEEVGEMIDWRGAIEFALSNYKSNE